MSSHHSDNHDHGCDHVDDYYIYYGGGSNFGFSDRDGQILGWIALILGIVFLIALLLP